MDSIEVCIAVSDEAVKEELIARLSVLDVDGFEEKDNELSVFYRKGEIDEKELDDIINSCNLTYSNSTIPEQNWNEVWESNFSPVIVDNFCSIRADFHEPINHTAKEIIITPKMSFGTGHHATTYMMIEQMKDIDFEAKRVADFGTGTGVLAILAEKLGADFVYAIDNDNWSIENAQENFERNDCKIIEIKKAGTFFTTDKFDVILANINKNVIIDNLNGLVFGLAHKGHLLLSGLLKEDEADIIIACLHNNLSHIKTVVRDKWISLLFINNFQIET